MEWSWRTLLIILGLVVVVVIVVDGLRRMRRDREAAQRFDLKDINERDLYPNSAHMESLRERLAADNAFAIPTRAALERKHRNEPLFSALPDDDPIDDRLSQLDDDIAPTLEPAEHEPLFERQYERELEGEYDHQASRWPEHDEANAQDETQERAAPEQDTEAISAHEAMAYEPLTLDELEPAPDEPIIPWQDELSSARVLEDEVVTPLSEEVEAVVEELLIPPSALIPKARPVNLDERVPVLIEVEELGDDVISQPSLSDTPSDELFDPFSAPIEEENDREDEVLSASDLSEQDLLSEDEPLDADKPKHWSEEQPTPSISEELEDVAAPLPLQPVNFPGANAEQLSARPEPEVVIEIHCIARDKQGFSGRDVLYLFNSCDLRFGEKNIFHRFELPDGEGCIQFSVAHSFNPGTFTPETMAEERFRGLSFFMSVPGAKKPLDAFEAMSQMALAVARNLKADLFDGARSALTQQTIEHDRQQLIDFVRRTRLASLKLTK